MISDKSLLLKTRQFLPGPTPIVSSNGFGTSVENIQYHRTENFYQVVTSCREKLARVMQTKSQPLIITSSGTGAMEAAVVNLTSEGDEVLVVNAGKFGERWSLLCQSYNCNVHELPVAVGDGLNLELFEESIKSKPKLKACFIQAYETSTGLCLPVEKISSILKAHSQALFVVDGISALCAQDLKMDSWHIDCLIGGSQKGFGVPPGLSFIALSSVAMEQFSDRQCFYFDLKREFKGQKKGVTAWTPAITLLEVLDQSLSKIEEIGLNNLIEHHSLLAQSVKLALKELGFVPLNEELCSNTLTAVYPPDGIDAKKLIQHLREKYKVICAGGQAGLSGKIVRFSHLGFVDTMDVLSGIAAVEFSLKDLGIDIRLGSGVGAFMQNLGKE